MKENIDQLIQRLKRQIRVLERLAGTLVVTSGDTIVTVQRADREKQRRQLRRK